jgi:hypothetical protein
VLLAFQKPKQPIHCTAEAPWNVLPAALALKIKSVHCFATGVSRIYRKLPFLCPLASTISLAPHQFSFRASVERQWLKSMLLELIRISLVISCLRVNLSIKSLFYLYLRDVRVHESCFYFGIWRSTKKGVPRKKRSRENSYFSRQETMRFSWLGSHVNYYALKLSKDHKATTCYL